MKRTFISRRKIRRNDFLVRTGLLRWLRRLLPRRSVLVLGYHALKTPDFLEQVLGITPAVERFEAEIAYIAENHPVLDLDQVKAVAEGTPPPPGAICITFDDGYRDVVDIALPILERHKLPAAVFLTTGVIGTNRSLWTNRLYWYIASSSDKDVVLHFPGGAEKRFFLSKPHLRRKEALALSGALKQLPPEERDTRLLDIAEQLGVDPDADPHERLPMLDWKHVRKLRDAGITIGSHTVTHPILSFCSPERQKEELVLSKQVIETHLDEPCRYLAYPNGQKGDFDDVTRSLVRKIGYDAAFSFTGGAVKTGMDPTALPRQPIFEIPLNSFAVSLAWS